MSRRSARTRTPGRSLTGRMTAKAPPPHHDTWAVVVGAVRTWTGHVPNAPRRRLGLGLHRGVLLPSPASQERDQLVQPNHGLAAMTIKGLAPRFRPMSRSTVM